MRKQNDRPDAYSTISRMFASPSKAFVAPSFKRPPALKHMIRRPFDARLLQGPCPSHARPPTAAHQPSQKSKQEDHGQKRALGPLKQRPCRLPASKRPGRGSPLAEPARQRLPRGPFLSTPQLSSCPPRRHPRLRPTLLRGFKGTATPTSTGFRALCATERKPG